MPPDVEYDHSSGELTIRGLRDVDTRNKSALSDLDYASMTPAQRADVDSHLLNRRPLSASIQKLIDEKQNLIDAQVAEREQQRAASTKALEARVAREWLRANPAELLAIIRGDDYSEKADE